MARITATDLKLAVEHVNDRMTRAGADYRYKASTRNGYNVVDAYKGTRNLFMVGCGSAKECIAALHSDAFDRVADALTERLAEAVREFTPGA